VEHIDGTLERLDDPSIFSSEFEEFPYIFSKERRDRIDGYALLELFRKWMVG
jgi:hypothetical protein